MTKIHIVNNGKIYTIQPPNKRQIDCYWYDAFIRYNNKIYIVNKIVSNRSSYYGYNFNSNEAKNLIENYIANA